MVTLGIIFNLLVAQVGFTHQYLTRDIKDNTEGILFTECLYEPNDTITVTPTMKVVIIKEIEE